MASEYTSAYFYYIPKQKICQQKTVTFCRGHSKEMRVVSYLKFLPGAPTRFRSRCNSNNTLALSSS